MGGSKNSSISNNVENMPPICGCEKVMKMRISNTDENPKRKFWKCRFAEYGCDLFIWDDELDEGTMMNSQKSGKYYDAGSSSGCNNCVMTMEFLREFGNNFGKEFGKEFGEEYGKRIEKGNGKEINSKKHEKLKMKFEAEKKKNFGLIVALVVSWIFFSFVFKLM